MLACVRCGKPIGDESHVEFRGQVYHRRCEYERPVTLVRVDMPFDDMAALIFRWSLAAIPTALFWLVVYVTIWFLL